MLGTWARFFLGDDMEPELGPGVVAVGVPVCLRLLLRRAPPDDDDDVVVALEGVMRDGDGMVR